MGKKEKPNHKREKAPHTTGSSRSRSAGAPAPSGNLWVRWRHWYATRNPVLRFLVVFCVLMAMFYTVTQLPVFKKHLFPAVITVNAHVGNAVLQVLGYETSIDGSRITSSEFTVDIHRGCDALEPIAFFVFALISFPAPLKRKWIGMAGGVALLFLLNIVRIVSLYMIGLKSTKVFEFMHEDVWQILFILVAIVLWGVWSFWATQSKAAPGPVASQT